MTNINQAFQPSFAKYGSAPRPVVLFVSPVADIKGGAERVLLDLLSNPSIEPALAVPGEGYLARVARERRLAYHFYDLGDVTSVHRGPSLGDLAGATRATWRCARVIAEIAQQTGAAVVHTNGLKVHVVGALVRLLSGLPVIAHLHDIPHTAVERVVWRGISLGVSRTILVSRPCYTGKTLPDRVSVVHNGVSSDSTAKTPRTLSATPTLGYLGRIHVFKGLHLLLDWFEAALNTRPELKLIIRGRADAEGTDYWVELQKRIAPLVTNGNCRVEDWRGPEADPYEDMDIVVVPSQVPDPAPRVVLEAMQRGVPVIAYPSGGIPILLGGNNQGALVTDSIEFAAALDRLFNPVTYQQVSQSAIERAQTHFSVPRFWREVNEQYCKMGLTLSTEARSSTAERQDG